MRITVVGLGKLGSPIAALYAAAGHKTVGIDLSPTVVDKMSRGEAPVNEPQLQTTIDSGRPHLSATLDWGVALKDSEASVVIVPTPSQPDGTFTNDYVIDAMRRIGEQVRQGVTSEKHVVIVASTVMPGSMAGEIQSALEEAAGQPLSDSLGLVYSPQFIALGSVVKNLQYPDMVLIGSSDRASGDTAESLLRSVVRSDASFQRMNLVNAEIVKISVNTFVTTKISFANMLSEICDALDGANVDVVTAAVGSDSRVGTKYLSGGLGYGGPCFPRDNVALAALGHQLGVDASIAIATDRVNDRQVARVVEKIRDLGNDIRVVDVWGLSYKPDTEVIEASQGVQIADALVEAGYEVRVHDPQVLPSSIRNPKLKWLDDPLTDSQPDVVVLATPWPSYLAHSVASNPKVAFLDPWGLATVGEQQRHIKPGR